MAEHLCDRIKTVDERDVFDLFVAEAEELSNPVADGVVNVAAPRRQRAENGNAVPSITMVSGLKRRFSNSSEMSRSGSLSTTVLPLCRPKTEGCRSDR